MNNQSYSVPINSARKGESSIYRHPFTENGLLNGPDYMNSLADVVNYSEKKFSNQKFLGTKQSDGPYEWQTYEEVISLGRAFGSGLMSEKIVHSIQEFRGLDLKFVGVYSKNRAEYIIADFACILYNLTSVPIYDTLGAQAIDFILEQTKMRVIICSLENVKKLISHGNFGFIQTLITFEKITELNVLSELSKRNIRYLNFWDLINNGKERYIDPIDKPNESSIYVISYTSGTTGNPKGALMTHRNFLSLISAATYGITLYPEDVYLSILPMAHVFERIMIIGLTFNGCAIGFFNGDPLKIKEDFLALRPTVVATVPRLLNRFYDAIKTNLASLTGCKKWLVEKAIATKLANLKRNNTISHCCYDKLVFKKVRDGFGGRLRLFVVGSAPTTIEVLEFLKIALCIPIQEGYGQTESTGASFATKFIDHAGCGTVGGPTVNTEFKIADIPEMNYSSKDVDEKGNPAPRGEMCIRGPGVFLGYYKDEEKTREAIDEEGWLHTGDVVLLLPNGAIKIIDRKKNIFKLSQGEYIAPEKLEGVYGKSSCVNEIFVWGDSFQAYLVGIVVPKLEIIKKWAFEKNISGNDDELLRNKEIRKLVLEELKFCAKTHKFTSFETLKNVFLEKNSFATKDLLTTTFKMKRNEAKKVYEPQIKEMYQEGMII